MITLLDNAPRSAKQPPEWQDDYVGQRIREYESEIARLSQQIRLLRLVQEARSGQYMAPEDF